MRRPAKLESIVAAMLAATLATAAAGGAEARQQRGSSARPDGPAPQAVRVEYNVMVPMRDDCGSHRDVRRKKIERRAWLRWYCDCGSGQ